MTNAQFGALMAVITSICCIIGSNYSAAFAWFVASIWAYCCHKLTQEKNK